MVKSISVLGCTGSIGRQTLAVARHTGIRVAAMTANRQIDLLEEQARLFRPEFVAVYDEQAAAELKTALRDTDIRVGSGMEGLLEAATLEQIDCVVTAVSGAVGLRPTLAAIERKKRIALANKETLVCAGEIVMKRAAETGAEIIPVDSEHSAVFQCLMGRQKGELRRILLTCSGGPFRGDSATLMNKGLEFIEAMRLFSVSPDDIQVVIHPQSVIHSMVELVDGTVIAQMGVPDMGLPIQLALTYPERLPSMFDRLDFTSLQDLSFSAPDLENFPCLRLAMDCARRGGTAGCVMSAANEEAVHLFLREKIGFNRIYDLAADAVKALAQDTAENLETVLEADAAARRFVHEATGS